MKSPDTGVRLSRPNPREEWVINEVPELRIIDQELWDDVQQRLSGNRRGDAPLWTKRRPTNLLSFLLRCGECGGGVSKVGLHRYGCSYAQNKGTCDNRLTIRQETLEDAVIGALRDNLMDPVLCAEFAREYAAHANRLRIERNASISAWRAEREKIQSRRDRIVKAIGDGFATEELKVEFNALIERRNELDRLIEFTPAAPVLLHPNMAERYRAEVESLTTLLAQPDRRAEAAPILRSLERRAFNLTHIRPA